MKLSIYKDESLTEIKRVVEAEKLKIPYRVSMYIIQSLEGVDIQNENDILHFITSSVDKVDKIIKATFGVTESELDCIDTAELISVAKELYGWAIGQLNKLKGNNEKNV